MDNNESTKNNILNQNATNNIPAHYYNNVKDNNLDIVSTKNDRNNSIPEKSTKKKSRRKLYIFLIVLLLLFILWRMFFVNKDGPSITERSKKNKPKNPTGSQPEHNSVSGTEGEAPRSGNDGEYESLQKELKQFEEKLTEELKKKVKELQKAKAEAIEKQEQESKKEENTMVSEKSSVVEPSENMELNEEVKKQIADTENSNKPSDDKLDNSSKDKLVIGHNSQIRDKVKKMEASVHQNLTEEVAEEEKTNMNKENNKSQNEDVIEVEQEEMENWIDMLENMVSEDSRKEEPENGDRTDDRDENTKDNSVEMSGYEVKEGMDSSENEINVKSEETKQELKEGSNVPEENESKVETVELAGKSQNNSRTKGEADLKKEKRKN